MPQFSDIHNIAIIAHVDHGKTTLVDALLKQTHTFRQNQEEMAQERIMDSNDLEREKGITILSKNTSVFYKNTKINIIDTPGHADFGGEVERVLNMANGALLVVDAAEGPLSQTKFVLQKAIEAKLKIILVINKIDRKDADINRVVSSTEDMILGLANDDSLLDFPIVYAVGRDGKAFLAPPSSQDVGGDISPLLDTILNTIPSSVKSPTLPFKMLVSAFERNQYLGRLALGRIYQGSISVGDAVGLINPDNALVSSFHVERLYVNEGIDKVEVTSAQSGEIIYVSGGKGICIGQTLASPSSPTALPTIEISEPTIRASFGPNTSIFAKGEAKFLTSRELKERLYEEVQTNLGLRIAEDPVDSIRTIVSGRGELHLAILIEKLRREGFALEVGKPEVIIKKIDGRWYEPFNELTILTSQDHVGAVTAELGKRKGQLIDMISDSGGTVKLIYKISERNALGLRSSLMTKTQGSLSLNFLFTGYEPASDNPIRQRNGVMIAWESGKALSYGLDIAQKRGITFVGPTEDVYEGQIVGLRPVIGDLEVNVCKGKQLTNMRAAGSDENIILAPPVKYSLEESLDFIEDDEIIDITPKNVRLRKRYLSRVDRVRAQRKSSS